jgi:hypothetical protein
MRKSVFVASIVAAVIAGSMIAGSGGWASSSHSSAYFLPSKHASSAEKLHATIYNPNAIRKSSARNASAYTTRSRQTVASGQNPCTLVTASEAGVILHAEVQSETEAPLGPTCILQVKGESQFITFALEDVNVDGQTRKMKHELSPFKIDGDAAYCGSVGGSLLYVKLGGTRALEVTAPCAAAEALAATAVPRITS